MKQLAIIAAAGALSFLLVACNGQDTTKPTAEKTEVQVVTPEKAPEVAPATAPEAAPAKQE